MKFLEYLETEYWQLNLWNIAFFIFGIIFYFSLSIEPSWKYITTISATSILTLLSRKRGIIYLLISGILASFSLGIMVGKIRNERVDTVALQDAITTKIEGRITNIKYTAKAMQIILDNIQFGTLLMQDKDPEKVRLTVSGTNKATLMIGDYVSTTASLAPPSRSIIPGGYDFGLFSYFSGVGANGFAISELEHIKPRKTKNNIDHYIQKLRKYIYLRLTDIMGKNEGNFAAALLIGEASGLDRGIMQDMRYSGLAHVLCVSGLHLSLVAGMIFIFTRVILNLSDRISFNCNIKIISAIISLLGSAIYLLLSGAQIAATRAYIMTSILMIGIALGKTPYPIRSLSIAAIIILTLNPEYILHPSFQLSFAAVLALIGGYEFYIKHKWILGDSHGILAKIKLFIFSNIYSSISASLATTPIVIYHFYTVANYTILANLLVVPLISFIVMPLGLLSMILLPFGLDTYTFPIMSIAISKIIFIANWTANLPGSVWHVGYITPLSLVVYIFGLFWLILWSSKMRIYGMLIIAFSIILMTLAKKPDVIFDPTSQILGIKNLEGKLEIHAKKISSFTKNYWNNWFGQSEEILHKEDITSRDYIIRTKSNKLVEIDFLTAPCQGDIVLNMTPSKECKNELERKILETTGAILILCKNEGCTARYNDFKRFLFK